MKNLIKICSFWLLFLAIINKNYGQLIVEKSALQVVLNNSEQQFVQKINLLADTKTSKYISIGDIAAYETNGMVTFNLPGLGVVTTEALNVEYNNSNDYIWSGKFTNQAGYFSIIVKPQGKVGFFQTATRYFSIQPVNSQISLLKEVDLTKLFPADCGTKAVESKLSIDLCKSNTNCNAEIDVLVLFTPDAITWFGNQPNTWQTILTIIQGIESINLAFINSGIENRRIRWRAEQYNLMNFAIIPQINDDLQELASEAAQLREQRQADIVILLTNMDYPNIAGAALNNEQNVQVSENDAYAIVEIQAIADPRWTFAHEFAHLLGANHNRSSNCSAADVCGDADQNDCAHGWVFEDGNDTEQRTIMARMFNNEGAARILNFSNPNVDFNGVPTGTEDNNNANILRNAACVVDNYNQAEWTAGFSGPAKWCTNVVSGIEFTSFVTPPNPGWGYLGNPPYQYEWRASCTPTFNASTFLSTQQNISFDNPVCSPSFWVQLTVTSAEGSTRISRRKVSVNNNCPQFDGGGDDRSQKFNLDITNSVIYPNPAIDMINIDLTQSDKIIREILIFDNFGRKLKQIVPNDNSLIAVSVANLQCGIYFVELKNDNGTEIYKFILNK